MPLPLRLHAPGFLLSTAVIALLLPQALSAQVSGTIEPDVWYINTEVMVNGTRLQGGSPSQARLCFAPEAAQDQKVCFPSNHANIIKWTAGNITFIPPKNAPPVGVLIVVHPYSKNECTTLYGKLQCKTVTERIETVLGRYVAMPHISEIREAGTNAVARALEAGKQYEIRGYRMGDTGRGIYVGNDALDATDVQRWAHDSILFTPSHAIPVGSGMRVHNGAGKSNIWLLQEASVTAEESKTGSGNVTVTRDELAEQESAAGTGDTLAEEESVPLVTFTDVAEDHPYRTAVTWAAEQGIVRGYVDGTLRPEGEVTRAEFLKMLLSAKGIPIVPEIARSPFTDVDTNAWYAKAVLFAQQLGVVRGYGDGTFKPDRTVTLAEALKMTYRMLNVPTLDPAGTAWYARYLEHAQANNVLFVNGMEPTMPLSRKDTLWILWRLQTDPTTKYPGIALQ